jgi:hypothetical protein
MTKEKAMKILKKAVKDNARIKDYGLYKDGFDDRYITAWIDYQKNGCIWEAQIIIEHDGDDVITSFIEFL